ncbi:MAG: molybdopterin molybdenumtransferase MoeA [Deltaproteobacteria bacterium]|nr:MAG: molybdopterin molybdenumtransferase MoeA [Deltaproteobacteria bacterium]
MELFKAVSVREAREMLGSYSGKGQPREEVPLLESLGRRLAEDIRAVDNVPGFDRSTMDGFAVRAQDTYGASDGLPAYLEIAGEVLMGREAEGGTAAGRAWRIATGGMLPPGADAVVMVEYTEELDGLNIGVTRPVAPGENVIRRGEDVAADTVILRAGHCIRPQDLGLLAAAGVSRAAVFSPARVAIISTGDELVAPDAAPRPGQVRDINTYTLYGAVVAAGGRPGLYGIVRDDFAELKSVLERALDENDMALVSGGSSVGARDVAAGVINTLGKPGVLFHGIAVKPGKPTVGAVVGSKPVFGLPGHPASALVVFELLVAPLLRAGRYPQNELEFPLRARLTRNVRSAAGREDYVRVRLGVRDGELVAEPVPGKSGLITTVAYADGLARIPAGKEGVEAGEAVAVKLFGA